MGNLLKLEYRRLFKSKSFYICLGVSLIVILITAASTKLLFDMMKDAIEGMVDNPNSALLQMKGIGTTSLPMVMAIFVTLFVTEDYSANTIKNIYAKGYSRDLVFFSKYVASLTASMIFIFACALFSLPVGKILFGSFGKAGHFYAGAFVAVIFTLIAYHTLFFMVAISLRKIGSALSISLIGPVVLELILTLITYATSEKVKVSDFWLDGILTNLSQQDVSGRTLIIAFTIGFSMIAGGLLVGFFANRTAEK